MTVLHLGHQPGDVIGAEALLTTNANAFDANLDINGLSINTASATQLYLDIPLPVVPSGDMWFSFRYRSASTGGAFGGDGVFFDVVNAAGSIITRVNTKNSTTGIYVQSHGDTIVESVGFVTQAANTNYWYDLKVTVGANIVSELYRDGVLVGTATAANTGGKAGPRLIRFQNLRMHSNVTAREAFLSHFAVMDGVSTIGRRFVRRRPNADSTYTAWVGGGASALNGFNPATRLASDVANERQSFTLQGPTGPTPTSIPAVHVKAKAQRGSTGPSKLNAFLRISATDYDETSETVELDRISHHLFTWTTNPNTSAAWTTGTLPTEVGIKSET